MSEFLVLPLAERPQHVPVLAEWHHREWHRLYQDWTLAVATAELLDHARRRTLPTTLVLETSAGDLLGSVSVVVEDAPELADYGTPWLASLYVHPDARMCGHGARLVAAAVALARRERVERLHLFTPGQAAFYARLGWQARAQVQLGGQRVDLMEIVP
ncbi:MAG TPA: GNAT family N-acetyltransferase [Xanthomonadales bacterium]|nr:GNAT family N-acetyltransferase [Xanthomonadales bacterium]